jgi:hypothetical protein
VRTALRVLLARIRRRPLELEGVYGTGHRIFFLTPKGQIMPPICGGAPDPPDPDPIPEPEPTPVPDPDPDPDPDPVPEPGDEPKFEGEYDEAQAKQAIAHLKARNRERMAKAKAELAKADARAKELEREKESEQETLRREAGEAKAEADRLRADAERMLIDNAIRDAASDADVPVKKLKRIPRLVDRDGIAVEDGEVEGATEAVEAFLTENPEFKGTAADPPDPEPDPEPGSSPDRKRKASKELTTEQIRKLAKEDPDKFNELYDAGKIPASALSGAK